MSNRSISSNNDHNAHLIPTDSNKSYTKLEQTLIKVTSTIITTLFLTVLMALALIHSLVISLFNKLSNKHNNEHNIHELHKEHTEEELKLVPDIAYYYSLLNLQVIKYQVITQDGFLITIQRIVNPNETATQKSNRPPILLLHGLLQSSGSFCSSGKQSLAYHFFLNGYDVWLGDNRCGFEPKHLYYDTGDYRMWDWDIKEMAQYDLSSLIDHAFKNGNGDKVVLVCHSQGTTQAFINLIGDKYGNCTKLKCFVGLSPAVYGGPLLERKWVRAIAGMSKVPYFFGLNSFLPIMMSMRKHLVGYRVFGMLSYLMFNYLFDWNDSLWDLDIKYRHFLFSPVYISVKLISWWLNIGFNGSSVFVDTRWFDENTPPMFLVIPKRDRLVNGERLVRHLKQHETGYRFDYVILDDYSHLDVLWSRNVLTDVGDPILSFIRDLDQ